METQIIHKLTANFEDSSNKTDDGVEFWLARDLQQLLGYDTWRSFFNAISKAKTACELSEQKVSDHFADVSKMIELPKNAEREIDDIMRPLHKNHLVKMR